MRSRLMLLSERLRLINFLNAPFVDLCRKEVRELATPFELEFGRRLNLANRPRFGYLGCLGVPGGA
jgi:hypothetical protein